MSMKAPQKDPERMVAATAEVLEREEIYSGTPVAESAIMDDARRVLIGVLKAAKRQKWDVAELLGVLDRQKPKRKHSKKNESSPQPGEP